MRTNYFSIKNSKSCASWHHSVGPYVQRDLMILFNYYNMGQAFWNQEVFLSIVNLFFSPDLQTSKILYLFPLHTRGGAYPAKA